MICVVSSLSSFQRCCRSRSRVLEAIPRSRVVEVEDRRPKIGDRYRDLDIFIDVSSHMIFDTQEGTPFLSFYPSSPFFFRPPTNVTPHQVTAPPLHQQLCSITAADAIRPWLTKHHTHMLFSPKKIKATVIHCCMIRCC